MTRRGLASALAAALGLGCGADVVDPPFGATASAIKDGVIEEGYPAVGLLFAHDNTGFVLESCSGTLIATNVIVTAGHCFDSNTMDAFYLGQGVPVKSGDSDWEKATVNMRRIAIEEFALQPDYVPDSGFPPTVVDMAVGRLAEHVMDVTPMPFVSAPPGANTSATVVGFGIYPTGPNDEYEQHVKRRAPVAISEILDTTLHQTVVDDGVPLGGDSGGPLFIDEAIVGTVCCGSGPRLDQTEQWYARIDLEYQWIVDMIAKWGGGGAGGIGGMGGNSGGAGGAGGSAGTGTSGAGGSTGGAGGSTGGAAGTGMGGTGTGGTGTGGSGTGGAGGSGVGGTAGDGGSGTGGAAGSGTGATAGTGGGQAGTGSGGSGAGTGVTNTNSEANCTFSATKPNLGARLSPWILVALALGVRRGRKAERGSARTTAARCSRS